MGGAYSAPAQVDSVLYDQYLSQLPSLEGKNIAVTGCTTGTGFQFAKSVLKLKCKRVFLLNRPSERADKARRELIESTVDKDSSSSRVQHVDCDLTDFSSVRKAAESVNKAVSGVNGGLHILVNNAAVMAFKDVSTKDGFDIQIQTNHLSHFLLTKLLFKSLKDGARNSSGPVVIVNHSSLARKGGNLEEKFFAKNSGGNLGGDGNAIQNACFTGPRWARYHQSKLANVAFTMALNERIKESSLNGKIVSLCAAPGFAATNLQVTTAQDGGFSSSWIMRMAQSAEDGTLPLLCCACGEIPAGADPVGEAIPLGISKAVNDPSQCFVEPRDMGGFYGPPIVRDVMGEGCCADPVGRTMVWRMSEEAVGEEFKVE